MDKYELVVIVDATLPPEEKDNVIKETGETIAKCEGKVINSQVWIDKHRFPFRMKRCAEGTYYMVNFESPRAQIGRLRQLLKLKEKILRCLIIRVQ